VQVKRSNLIKLQKFLELKLFWKWNTISESNYLKVELVANRVLLLVEGHAVLIAAIQVIEKIVLVVLKEEIEMTIKTLAHV
jgi:hypothetical protein